MLYNRMKPQSLDIYNHILCKIYNSTNISCRYNIPSTADLDWQMCLGRLQ